ncbi:MAG: hypothetical protein HQK83_03645 [Fibrobacteria bacterium]|nr:hypothetical protein [Fibrobacteria bacterium]
MDLQKSSEKKPVGIFTYLDCRKYLTDFFKSDHGEDFPFQDLINQPNTSSESSFNTLETKTEISPQMAEVITIYCKLNKRETLFFKTLVLYNQSKTLEIRKDYLSTLINLANLEFMRIADSSYDVYLPKKKAFNNEKYTSKPAPDDNIAVLSTIHESV